MIATAVFTLLWLGHAFLSSPLVPLVPYQFPHEEVGRGEEGQGRGERGIRIRWVREQKIVTRGIKLVKVDTKEQLGDIFTKGLVKVAFDYLENDSWGGKPSIGSITIRSVEV